MMAKFATALAGNIRVIAESTAALAALEQFTKDAVIVTRARAEHLMTIRKAEERMSLIFQQPGSWRNE